MVVYLVEQRLIIRIRLDFHHHLDPLVIQLSEQNTGKIVLKEPLVKLVPVIQSLMPTEKYTERLLHQILS